MGNYLIFADLTDDNDNLIHYNSDLIDNNNFKFLINNTEVEAEYNNTNNHYEANYEFNTEGTYLISTNYNEISTKTAEIIVKYENIYNFYDLQYLINNTSENGILILNHSYTYNSIRDKNYINGIILNKNITINGNGFTISGNSSSRIFYIESGIKLDLNNMTLTKGYSEYGGAIYNYNSNLTLINMTIKDNKVNNDAGAIYNKNSTLTIENSTLQNNTANYGGAIYNCDNSNLTIKIQHYRKTLQQAMEEQYTTQAVT